MSRLQSSAASKRYGEQEKTILSNVQRMGCPNKEILAALTTGILPPRHPAYAHVLTCAECFAESRISLRNTVISSGVSDTIIHRSEHPDRSVQAAKQLHEKPQFISLEVWKRAQYYSCTQKVVEYIAKHFDAPLCLDDMAKVACMERTTFSRAFRRRTGITFHEFVQAYRISQAATKMQASDYSITEIAFSVGFSSLDTFARVFRKVAGTIPSHYRIELLRNSGLLTNAPTFSKGSK